MQISTGFEVDAPFQQVWEALLDLERVAPCVPGAQIEERIDAATARGRFRVRLGPVGATYRGTITIDEADRESGNVVLRGQGNDTGAGGTATMVVRNHVRGTNGTTTVQMDTDVTLTGRAAQLGGRRSIMQSVADRMVDEFAAALRDELSGAEAAPPAGKAAPPLDGGRLLRGLAGDHVAVVAGTCVVAGVAAGVLLVRMRGRR
jgi:carbon monoxide dehydrogenase subunit G